MLDVSVSLLLDAFVPRSAKNYLAARVFNLQSFCAVVDVSLALSVLLPDFFKSLFISLSLLFRVKVSLFVSFSLSLPLCSCFTICWGKDTAVLQIRLYSV